MDSGRFNEWLQITVTLITVLVLEIFIVFLTLRCANFAALIHLHSNQVEDICLLLLLADLANYIKK